MKPLKQFLPMFVILLFPLISCDAEVRNESIRVCDSGYFYYASEKQRVFLKQSRSEVWITFEQYYTEELVTSILNKYSFLIVDSISSKLEVKASINDRAADCSVVNGYLKVLNEDKKIYSATPIFYLDENDADSYYIVLSEVNTKHDPKINSALEFGPYAETLNLELLDSIYSTQHFKVKDIKTGFESLEIAKQIFEGGKVEYAIPNFRFKAI